MNRTKYSKAGAVALIGLAGWATLGQAQPMGDRGPGPGPQAPWHGGGPSGPARGGMREAGRPMPPPGPGGGPDQRFHRGDRLPPEWHNRQYVVDDWRGHRLAPPPRGYHWVQVGADYALVAIASGVIASLILNH